MPHACLKISRWDSCFDLFFLIVKITWVAACPLCNENSLGLLLIMCDNLVLAAVLSWDLTSLFVEDDFPSRPSSCVVIVYSP